MAVWTQSVSLTEPLGLGAVADGIDTLATAANGSLDAAAAALDAAKVFVSGTVAPDAAAAAALVTTARNVLEDLFGAGYAQLVVHPWTPGVSRGQGAWKSLSFPNAVRAIVASLDDMGDPERPLYSAATPVEAIVLVAGAPSPALFKGVLEALNALLDAKELRLAIRRIAQAFELEAERFSAPVASTPPDWQAVTLREAIPAMGAVEGAVRDNLALLEAYAEGGNTAVDMASALVATKRAQLTALQTKLAEARALFGAGLNGAGVYALHLTGVGGTDGLQNELTAATGGAGPELSFCAGVAWVAPDGGLTTLADLLGV